MSLGGDIDRTALLESFARIKEDIARLSIEMSTLKVEHSKLMTENHELKTKLSSSQVGVDAHTIRSIVKEAIESSQKPKQTDPLLRRLNKKRKGIIQNRIYGLADSKHHSLPDIKDVVVDQEGLCSKATFYRYIEKMKAKGLIDILTVQDTPVVVKLQ